MKKQITIRSLFMMAIFALISFTGYSQVSTLAGQTAGTATLTLIKKTNDTLAQSARVHTNTLTNISNSLTIISTTLNIVKQKSDTINQSLRVISTALATNSVVGGYGKISNGAAIVMSVAGAYATGEYMGTSTTPQSFTNCVRSNGNTATIKSVTISDKITDSNVAMELWLFSATFTAPTDNATWTVGDDDALNVIAVIPIAANTWYATGANQIYHKNDLNIKIKPAATSVFYALVARGTTPAFTSGDLTISLGIDQD